MNTNAGRKRRRKRDEMLESVINSCEYLNTVCAWLSNIAVGNSVQSFGRYFVNFTAQFHFWYSYISDHIHEIKSHISHHFLPIQNCI